MGKIYRGGISRGKKGKSVQTKKRGRKQDLEDLYYEAKKRRKQGKNNSVVPQLKENPLPFSGEELSANALATVNASAQSFTMLLQMLNAEPTLSVNDRQALTSLRSEGASSGSVRDFFPNGDDEDTKGASRDFDTSSDRHSISLEGTDDALEDARDKEESTSSSLHSCCESDGSNGSHRDASRRDSRRSDGSHSSSSHSEARAPNRRRGGAAIAQATITTDDISDDPRAIASDSGGSSDDSNSAMWTGFELQSFNSQLPSAIVQPGKTHSQIATCSPIGFNLCRSLYAGNRNHYSHGFHDHLRGCVEEDVKRLLLTSDCPFANLDPRIGARWGNSIVPRILADEKRWHELSKLPFGSAQSSFLFTPQASTLARVMTHYIDACFLDQSYLNSLATRSLVALHLINHVTRSKLIVTRNSRVLKSLVGNARPVSKKLTRIKGKLCEKRPAGDEKEEESALDPSGDDRFRDQGYTRARVLVLTPTKQSAKDFVDTIIGLLPKTKQVGNRNRYLNEFFPEDASTERERNAIMSGEPLVQNLKPLDFVELFRGNNSDQFHIGIRVHNSSATLCSPLYESDIIVASPLGLRLVIGAEGESRDFDFLSSIEILVLDRADVLLMQNWEHVRDVLNVMNVKPLKWRKEWDIRRLRNSYLGDLARNFRGGLPLFTSSSGSIVRDCALRVAKQLFLSVPVATAVEISQSICNVIRLEFPFPFLSVTDDDTILLVCPSYLEYLRVRKVLRSSPRTMKDSRGLHRFVSCHEYTPVRKTDQYRTMFVKGQLKLMVTTERYLFFRRPLLKGANHVVFLAPPETPGIYVDCLKALRERTIATSCVLYAATVHAMALERIVGLAKLPVLMSAPRFTSKLFVLS